MKIGNKADVGSLVVPTFGNRGVILLNHPPSQYSLYSLANNVDEVPGPMWSRHSVGLVISRTGSWCRVLVSEEGRAGWIGEWNIDVVGCPSVE